MKTKIKTLVYFKLILSIVFACLFYQQSPALNILLFAFLLITGLFCLKSSKTPHPYSAYCLFAMSAISVFIYGNILSLVCCLLMFIVLAGKLVFHKQAHAFSILPGFINIVCALPYRLHRTLSSKLAGPDGNNNETVLFRLFKIVLVTIVVSVFFLLYMDSSAGFATWVDTVNIEFPRFNFWLMLLIGAFICNAIYHHAGRSLLKGTTPKKPETIKENPMDESSSKSWLSTGTALFVTLNILIVIVLVSDLHFILSGTMGQHSPSFYSQIVHEGVSSLILSVILAIALLFIFFEGRINFLKGNRVAKTCAYLWILCNLMLVLLTVYKNGLYISELGMTYKRIGVWYYLGASCIGLCFMYIKIKQYKNFLYMIRKVVSIYLFILVISAFVPWEIAVTKFNISQAEKKGIAPDISYLLSLDGNNLHLIRDFADQHHLERDTIYYNMLRLPLRIQYYEQRVTQKDFRSLVLMEQISVKQLNTPLNKQSTK